MAFDQLLPTTVIGSHALSGWFWTAMDADKRGEYGPSDEQEVYDDAVRLAIWDQKEAVSYIEKEDKILRPENLIKPSPGKGFKVYNTTKGQK